MRCWESAGPQWARKFKKVQPKKKLVKSNKSKKFFSWNCIFGSFLTFSQFKNWFLAIFEIAKNGIWSKKLFVKFIYSNIRRFDLASSDDTSIFFSIQTLTMLQKTSGLYTRPFYKCWFCGCNLKVQFSWGFLQVLCLI